MGKSNWIDLFGLNCWNFRVDKLEELKLEWMNLKHSNSPCCNWGAQCDATENEEEYRNINHKSACVCPCIVRIGFILKVYHLHSWIWFCEGVHLHWYCVRDYFWNEKCCGIYFQRLYSYYQDSVCKWTTRETIAQIYSKIWDRGMRYLEM